MKTWQYANLMWNGNRGSVTRRKKARNLRHPKFISSSEKDDNKYFFLLKMNLFTWSFFRPQTRHKNFWRYPKTDNKVELSLNQLSYQLEQLMQVCKFMIIFLADFVIGELSCLILKQIFSRVALLVETWFFFKRYFLFFVNTKIFYMYSIWKKTFWPQEMTSIFSQHKTPAPITVSIFTYYGKTKELLRFW